MIRYARKRFATLRLGSARANQERKQVVNDNNFVNVFGTICSLPRLLSSALQGVG